MPQRPPDLAALTRAFDQVVEALGVDRADPELARTPQRAAQAWVEEFVDGYGRTATEALGELSDVPANAGPVTMTGIDFVGVCPHHLLPYRGVAHVTYQPGTQVPGFGRLAALVDTLSHRLLLQETLAAELAIALVDVLQARGAAVVLEAEQSCLSMRGERRPHARAIVESHAGPEGASLLPSLRERAVRAS